MAIRHTDSLSRILQNDTLTERDLSFLWLVCAQKDHSLLEVDSRIHSSRSRIADCLLKNPEMLNQVWTALQNRLIPFAKLSWVRDDVRQSSWIAQNASGILMPNPPPLFPYGISSTVQTRTPIHLQGRNLSIAIIDYCAGCDPLSLTNAINSLARLHSSWLNQIQQDRIFEWVSQDDESAGLTYFWNWLAATHQELVFLRTPFQSHGEMLIFFDRPEISAEKKELISGKARKAWTQQRYRARISDRKQCNFLLSDDTIKKLEKLSLKHKLSRTEIIELLIDSEVKGETYIKERLYQRELLSARKE